ncbi:MAG: hypothetical protein H6710_14465 [Myxococcales bacterium]|nr:hypothetical protein [Myxococcales bacterium]
MLLGLLLAPVDAAAARAELVEPPVPRFERVDVSHGFPQGSTYGIAEGGDGYLWLTTLDGLVRFDGARHRVYDRGVAGLPTTRLTALHARASSGELWIGAEDGRVFRARGDRFSTLAIDELRGGGVTGIWVDDAGERVVVFRQGSVEELVVTDDEGPEIGVTRGRAFAGVGLYGCPALVADGALWWTDRGGLRSHPLPPEVDGSPWIVCRGEVGGGLWIRAEGSELWRVDGERLVLEERRASIPSDAIPLGDDGDGGLWLRFRGAPHLGRLDRRGRVIRYDERHGVDALGDPTVVFGDHEGGQWIGTSIGLYRHLGEAIGGLLLRVEGVDVVVSSHFEASDGVVWIAGRDGSLWALQADGEVIGLSVDDASGHKILRLERTLDAVGRPWSRSPAGFNALTVFREDARGQLWIGADIGLLRARGDGMVSIFPTSGPDGVIPGGVNDILADGDGLWLASTGVVRVEGDALARIYGPEDGVREGVLTLMRDHQGGLWAGTRAGALRMVGDRFEEVSGLGPELGQVRALHEDDEGRIWAGTYDSGLFRRLVDGTVEHVGAAEGLQGGVFTLHFDARGFLWTTSNRGLTRARAADVDAALRGGARIATVLYDRASGLPASECNGGFGSAGYRCEGDAWCVHTMGGVGVARLDEIRVVETPPVPVIEEIRVDGVLRALAGGRLQVLPGERDLVVRYTGVTFEGADEVRFRYRLDGHAERWSEAASREAHFNDLPPGEYTFEVFAESREGVMSPTPARLVVEVAPAWWELRTVRIAVALAVAAVAAVAAQWRLRAIVRVTDGARRSCGRRPRSSRPGCRSGPRSSTPRCSSAAGPSRPRARRARSRAPSSPR